MIGLFSLVPLWARLLAIAALVAAVIGAYAAWTHHQREIGRDEIRAEWNAERLEYERVAREESEDNARETARRLKQQKENQDVQDKELARARDDAARNRNAADGLREQNAVAARQWRDALADSPTGSQCTAAADAIGVLSELLGRADRRAGILAAYADAARAAGLKCERDYGSLTAP